MLLALAALFSLAACHGNIDPDDITGGGGDIDADTVTILSTGYVQKMVAMQFTSVGCVNCPILSSAMKDLTREKRNVIPVAFHMDYGGYADPMTLSVNTKFYEKVNTGDGMGLPLFALNFRKSSRHIINEYAKMKSEVEAQAELYPAVCGVAVESSYDPSDRKLEVKARFKADVPGVYRYHIFLVEDGIEYSQAGAEGAVYVHDNVLRRMYGDNVLGNKLNGGKKLEAGKEYEATMTLELPEEWNAEKMRVVVMMLDTKDDGETFCCNNAAQCALGESADYAIAGQEEIESRFERNVCVMEFTGTWCAQCPEGAVTLNYLVSKAYAGKAYALAFHNNDEYAIPAEQELMKIFKWEGYPAFVTDMMPESTGSLNDGGCAASIDRSLYDTETHCGVAVESSHEAGKVTVKAKVFSEKTMDYRIAAYVIEDKVVGEQTLGTGQVQEDYTHRHMVRKMLCGNVRGDSLGEIKAEEETEKTFTFDVEDGWNVENLSVAVLAINEDGHVNNMAVCAADAGKTEYEYINQ